MNLHDISERVPGYVIEHDGDTLIYHLDPPYPWEQYGKTFWASDTKIKKLVEGETIYWIRGPREIEELQAMADIVMERLKETYPEGRNFRVYVFKEKWLPEDPDFGVKWEMPRGCNEHADS